MVSLVWVLEVDSTFQCILQDGTFLKILDCLNYGTYGEGQVLSSSSMTALSKMYKIYVADFSTMGAIFAMSTYEILWMKMMAANFNCQKNW